MTVVSPARQVFLFAFTHAVVTLGLTVYAFAAGMAEFDDPDLPHSVPVALAGNAADVLMLPGRLVWTASASKNLPNAIESVVFLANSVVWGLVLGATPMLARRARKDHRL
jgi:hypothetical protein